MCSTVTLVFGLGTLAVVAATDFFLSPFNIEVGTVTRIWDEKKNRRFVDYTNCDCGTGLNVQGYDKPWNVFIEVTLNKNTNQTKLCTGTIITSDLVITSHKCLTRPGKNISVYDLWSPRLTISDKPWVNQNDIMVAEKINTTEWQLADDVFPIKEIIYNTDYVMQAALNRTQSSDIALIRLNADFTRHPRLKPICIPEYDKNLDILYQKANYYGASTVGDLWESTTREIPFFVDTVIWSKNECTKEKEKNSMLCAGFPVNLHDDFSPEVEGGPLILFNENNRSKPAFLVGIANQVGMAGSVENHPVYGLAYFSNIIPLIKYIEYKANKLGSRWCRTPKLQLPPKATAYHGRWIWEVEGPKIQRDESLDCVCGINNDGLPKARASGGQESVPYNYGWMTFLYIRKDPTARSSILCGGSIINDRMIMTAAHCVARADLIGNGIKAGAIASPRYTLTLANMHVSPVTGQQDPEGKQIGVREILVHPEYNFQTLDYDFALLVLAKPIQFVENEQGIRPICLQKPGEHMEIVGKTGRVTGWGRMNYDDPSSLAPTLQQVDIPIRDRKDCMDLSGYNASIVTDRFVCSTNPKTKTSTEGDSGGPLSVNDTNGQWYQVGVVSGGRDMGNGQSVDMFTSVEKMLPYIDYLSKRYRAMWCKR